MADSRRIDQGIFDSFDMSNSTHQFGNLNGWEVWELFA